MKYFIVVMMILGLSGCQKKITIYNIDPKNGGNSNLEEKYAKIEDVLKGSCLTAGCHAGGNIVDLGSGARLAASNSKARIENGSMPPPNSGPGQAFNDSKKTLLLSFFN